MDNKFDSGSKKYCTQGHVKGGILICPEEGWIWGWMQPVKSVADCN